MKRRPRANTPKRVKRREAARLKQARQRHQEAFWGDYLAYIGEFSQNLQASLPEVCQTFAAYEERTRRFWKGRSHSSERSASTTRPSISLKRGQSGSSPSYANKRQRVCLISGTGMPDTILLLGCPLPLLNKVAAPSPYRAAPPYLLETTNTEIRFSVWIRHSVPALIREIAACFPTNPPQKPQEARCRRCVLRVLFSLLHWKDTAMLRLPCLFATKSYLRNC